MLIRWNGAIKFNIFASDHNKLGVSARKFPQFPNISADSVRVSAPFSMSEPQLAILFNHLATRVTVGVSLEDMTDKYTSLLAMINE